MAVGRDLRGTNENVVVVAGDAALTCGISYEAMNNAKSQTKRFIVVLNDNEWSIAKNVGAIASYLNNIVANPTYAGLHDKARRFVEAVAGKSVVQLAHKIEEGVKNLIVPSVIFEELGLRYYGPIDGHDIPLLIKTFEFLKDQDDPVLLHILTKKGKGYEPAIAKPDKFHGLGKFAADTGETAAAATPDLLGIARQDSREVCRIESEHRRHHSRDAERHRTGVLPGRAPGALFRCRHRGGACRAFRLWTRDAGAETVPDDLLDVHATGLRHDHS
ncbi:MAG: 1-deoxy-D-xylulose-5-phosphate synthase N-terminal domain-containing protein [Geodermatophilaceae bacterium]